MALSSFIASAVAFAAAIVVKYATLLLSTDCLMVLASVLLPALSEVLMARAISSFLIISSIFGRPSDIFSTFVDATPAA